MKKQFLSILILITALSACSGFPLTGDSQPGRTPTPGSQANAVLQQSATAQPVEDGGFLLNEICFLPSEGDSGYIELINVGTDALPLDQLRLENEKGESLFFPQEAMVGPKRIYLIRFEASEDAEADVLFLPENGFLSAASGQIKLLDKNGTLLDSVAWGPNQAETVKMGYGGVQQEAEPGGSIGRSPGSNQINRWDWVTYTRDNTSPGADNPMPAVQVMQPLNGAIFPSTIVQLLWYPIPGAAQYRLQIARNDSFTNIAMDETVSSAFKYTNPLAAGTYYWRVQAISQDGTQAAFSPSQSFQIQLDNESSADGQRFLLDVPILHQHKDSRMLLLESQHEDGDKAWNRAHNRYDPNEPAHISNNPMAVIAMLNHFYGGDITQDRLGYEIFKERSAGTELDLAFGIGPTMAQVDQLLTFALNGTASQWQSSNPGSMDEQKQFVSFVKNNIAAGHPVMAYTPGHFVLIQGYETIDTLLIFSLIDPAAGVYRLDADQPTWLSAFTFTDTAAAKLEDTLLSDSDEDGILDFDESERFHTGVFKADSDEDGISDLVEIQASVFDPQYGYGLHPLSRARDIDMDGLTMELDFDSDNGGCIDSFEDRDKNGRYAPQYQETSNFDPGDDSCFALEMTWTYQDDWGNSTARWVGSLGIDDLNDVFGIGVVILSHEGACTKSEMQAGFTIKGKLKDQIELNIVHEETFEVSTFAAEELKPGCSLAMGIEENWTVSHGIYAGMPESIVIPLPPSDASSTLALATHPDAPRRGTIALALINRLSQN